MLLSYHNNRPLKVLLTEGAASSKLELHSTSDQDGASVFVVSPDFLLVLDGTQLVLSRLRDGSVAMTTRRWNGSTPFVIHERNVFPRVSLELQNESVFLRGKPEGTVDTAVVQAEWETWSIAIYHKSVATLAK